MMDQPRADAFFRTLIAAAVDGSAHLFQPFVTTKEKGMGIGLTICQSIIEAHNGRIWATPNQDDGVEFRFRLPVTALD